MAGLSREALRAYLAAHYRPNRTILGLAGQVTPGEALALAEPLLAGWQPGSPASYEPAPPNHTGPSLHVERRDVEQAHLSFSFASVSRLDPDRFVVRLLNVLLGEGMRSRLFQEVRERLGLAYSVDSYISLYEDAGAFGIYAGVAPGRIEDSIRAILGELDRLRQEPVPEDELDKAREFVKGRLALSLEDSFAVAAWYAQQQILGQEVLDPEQVIAHLEAVQPADIQRLAQTLFREEGLNLAVVGPFADNGDRVRQAVRL